MNAELRFYFYRYEGLENRFFDFFLSFMSSGKLSTYVMMNTVGHN